MDRVCIKERFFCQSDLLPSRGAGNAKAQRTSLDREQFCRFRLS